MKPILSFFLIIVHTIILGCSFNNRITEKRTVDVFKYTDRVQCEGETLEQWVVETRKFLESEGVKTLTTKVSTDGLMYATVCGSPTGEIVIFTIWDDDLDSTLKAGFKLLKQK